MTLGLPKGTVLLTDYDDAWQQDFVRAERAITDAAGDLVLRIEHIGSTAIDGAIAKPIIDLLVGVRAPDDGPRLAERLAPAGYESLGEFGIPGRTLLTKGDPVTHHLHAVDIESAFWQVNMIFRDALRRDPDALARYVELKRELARRFADDRARYTEGKSAFIRAVLRDAGCAYEGLADGIRRASDL
ncbi:MAG: GrpB family protein [Planctomycetota bacterium]